MENACTVAEVQLSSTNEVSKVVLERAGSLRDERQEVEDKKSIINLFLGRFTLSDQEAEAITSRDVPISQRFFDAMSKTENIREDCRVLMAGEDGAPTTTGLEIMSSTSTHLEQGFAKILRWISNEFRALGGGTGNGQLDDVDVHPLIREAVTWLKRRPELLTEALTILSEARQTSLLAAFITALTRGGPSGLPRPIELHAHDPMRYVGDMLAWVHQAIAAEREFLEGLFGAKSDGRMMGSVRDFGRQRGEEEEWIQELMDLAVSKLCVPLKNRVLQTVRSQESSIVSYKIANLLQFYLDTMQRTVGHEALLTKTLQEITEVSYNVFQTSIETHSKGLAEIPLDLDDPSLTPPHFILDHALILREVMNVYQSSIIEDWPAEVATGQKATSPSISIPIEKILDAVIDPVVLSCISKSEEKMKSRPKWDGKFYTINCLTYLLSLLEPYTFTKSKQETLYQVIEYRVTELIESHFTDLMTEAGLLAIYITFKSPPTDEPLSRLPQTSTQSLRSALTHFSTWLSNPDIIIVNARLSHLSVQSLNPKLQNLSEKVHKAALGKVVRAYGLICGEVLKEGNRYEAGATLLGSVRPFGRVYLLRQIFGIEEEEEAGSSGEEESEGEESEGEEESEEESAEEAAESKQGLDSS